MKKIFIYMLAISLLLSLSPAQAAPEVNQAPAELTLGGLFPLTGTLSGGGVEREAAARMAVNEINSRSDILPDTDLTMTVRNTETLATTGATVAQELIDLGAFGLVGAASSSVSIAISAVSQAAEVPQISYSSTNAALSNKTEHPYFLRVVPPDSVQGVALASIVYNDLGIDTVSTLATSDDYGAGGIGVFETAFVALGGTIDVSQQFTQGGDPATQLTAIAAGTARDVVLNAIVGDAKTVFDSAATAGITPGNGWQWIGTDGPTQEQVFEGSASTEAAMGNMIGTSPNRGAGDQWLHFKDMWQCGNPADYAGSGDRDPNTFATFAYDAVYAFAWAAHDMIVAGDDPEVGADLLAELKLASFEGATGQVGFDANGDREGVYDILNLEGGSFATVGSWDAVNGLNLFGNATFTNGTVWVGSGAGDPNADPADRSTGASLLDCDLYAFNDPDVTVTDTQIDTVTETGAGSTETVTSVSVSTESPGFGLLLALISVFAVVPILRRKN